jgi:hypothetical protein
MTGSCSCNGLQSLLGDQREELERGAARMFRTALPLTDEPGGDVEVAGVNRRGSQMPIGELSC